MPFAGHERRIPSLFQYLSDGHTITVDVSLITAQRGPGHRAHTRLMCIQTGHQRRPWGNSGRYCKLRVPQAILRQLIKIGRLNLAAVTTDIRKTHVIGHDQNNVGRNALSPAIAREAQHKKTVRKRVIRLLNHSIGRTQRPSQEAAIYIDPLRRGTSSKHHMKHPYAFTLLLGIGLLFGAGANPIRKPCSWATFSPATW